MINGRKVIVVMPAYNAERTVRQTFAEIPHDVVDEVVLVDDASQDHTVRVAEELNLHTIVHSQNRGHGGNQKTCYKTAVDLGGEIVIMLHPDYQYTPKLIRAMASLLGEVLQALPLESNSEDFVFENQMLAQIIHGGYRISEITCPTRYNEDSSSINFGRSVVYGLGVIKTSLQFRLQKWGFLHLGIFRDVITIGQESS
jgi:glycosyltransferase involved in cell wall biosynthesis